MGKPRREWLFGEEDETKRKKKKITWEKGKENKKIIEKKRKGNQ